MEENNKPTQPAAAPNPVPTPEPAVSQSTAPAPPQQTTPVAGANTNPKKKQVIIGAIIAAVLLAGAIAYGVYAYVTNQPDYMLGKALEQIGKEEALAAKFSVTTGSGSNGSAFTGDIAAREDKAAKASEAVIGIGSGANRVAVTARVFEDTTFLRLGSLSNVPNLVKTLAPGQESTYNTPEFKAALERIDNKWFSLTKDEAAGVAQSTGSAGASGFKPDDFKKAVEIYQKHPFFKADKTFADEAIDGVNTAHFSIKIDKPTYKAFLKELKNANLESFKPTDEDINNSDKDADEFAKSASAEFWIARGSNKFKQMKFAGTESGNETSVVLTMVTELPKFDKLEKPGDAVPFNEFMTLFLGASFEANIEADPLTGEDLNQ